MSESCKSCRFYKAAEDPRYQGWCRRHPNQLEKHHEHWCGEYEAIPVETASYPRDFTAEKDIYSRVYAVEIARSLRTNADKAAQSAVEDMMKFFDELQEKQ